MIKVCSVLRTPTKKTKNRELNLSFTLSFIQYLKLVSHFAHVSFPLNCGLPCASLKTNENLSLVTCYQASFFRAPYSLLVFYVRSKFYGPVLFLRPCA